MAGTIQPNPRDLVQARGEDTWRPSLLEPDLSRDPLQDKTGRVACPGRNLMSEAYFSTSHQETSNTQSYVLLLGLLHFTTDIKTFTNTNIQITHNDVSKPR